MRCGSARQSSRALERAAALDHALAQRQNHATADLPLLGVPFAVKNLFDVRGLATRAGSKIERESAPAENHAMLVRRMESAGAFLVGTLNRKDHACAQRPVEPCAPQLMRGFDGARIAVLDGYFQDYADSDARAAVESVVHALGATRRLELPEVARARAAAFLITNAEGVALHLPDLRRRAADFEPLSRDRFLAGALLSAAWITQAQRVRQWFAAPPPSAYASRGS